MKNRAEKLKIVQQIFSTGDLQHLKGTNEMVIHTVIIERNGLYEIVEIKPTFEIPDHEMTLKEFESWKGCIPLFPDIKSNFKKLDLSTWTNEQLEARLAELTNTDEKD